MKVPDELPDRLESGRLSWLRSNHEGTKDYQGSRRSLHSLSGLSVLVVTWREQRDGVSGRSKVGYNANPTS